MKCLVVIAHPLEESLCQSLASQVCEILKAAGHETRIEDLYHNNFNAALNSAERASYYRHPYESSSIQAEVDHLLSAEGLVICFPTWWFGFPAILKGWFDRIWGPGIAYDHATDLGAIKPRLHRLKKVLIITTLGSPWWVDKLIMRQPVKRILKTAILGTCAPACQFEMLTLYRSEQLNDTQVGSFVKKIKKALSTW